MTKALKIIVFFILAMIVDIILLVILGVSIPYIHYNPPPQLFRDIQLDTLYFDENYRAEVFTDHDSVPSDADYIAVFAEYNKLDTSDWETRSINIGRTNTIAGFQYSSPFQNYFSSEFKTDTIVIENNTLYLIYSYYNDDTDKPYKSIISFLHKESETIYPSEKRDEKMLLQIADLLNKHTDFTFNFDNYINNDLDNQCRGIDISSKYFVAAFTDSKTVEFVKDKVDVYLRYYVNYDAEDFDASQKNYRTAALFKTSNQNTYEELFEKLDDNAKLINIEDKKIIVYYHKKNNKLNIKSFHYFPKNYTYPAIDGDDEAILREVAELLVRHTDFDFVFDYVGSREDVEREIEIILITPAL